MVCTVQMKVKPGTKDYLDKLKIHPRQTYDEVIRVLIKKYSDDYFEVKENGME